MKRYRKRSREFEAVQIDSMDYDGLTEIVGWCGGRAVDHDDHLIAIDTPGGTMYADHGDWIIKGVMGEFYPCRPDIFAATCEPVEAES